MKPFYITALTFLNYLFFAQDPSTRIVTGTASIGVSAISTQTLVAKTYQILFPIYGYGTDSASHLFIFSAHEKTEEGDDAVSRGFIGTFDMVGDSVNWTFASNYYELTQSGNYVFFSNDDKTTRYNKLHGFVELNYPERLIYTLPSLDKTFLYKSDAKDIVSCVKISDGTTEWSAPVPGTENWVDVRETPDSILLVAASGLHAIRPRSGVVWSYPLSTATVVSKALTYSLVNQNSAIRRVSKIIKTLDDDVRVTELASNILVDNNVVFFAAREKMIAVTMEGKLLWELDLKGYPVSKMFLSKRGSSLMLINFGLARYGENYVTHGSPFAMNVDPQTGVVKYHNALTGIENLVDFSNDGKLLIFAGKNTILEVKEGSNQVDTLILDGAKYGNFAEFIDGNIYYAEREGFYVPLNFINSDNIYFRVDNNKVYGLDKNGFNYSFHYTDIYKLEKRFDDKLILLSQNKSLVLNSNRELLCTIDLGDKPVVMGKRIYFVGKQIIHSLNVEDIK